MYDIREEDQDAARRATMCTHVRAYACACACVCVQVCRVVQCVERYSEATRGATRAVATAKGLQIGTSGECVTSGDRTCNDKRRVVSCHHTIVRNANVP